MINYDGGSRLVHGRSDLQDIYIFQLFEIVKKFGQDSSSLKREVASFAQPEEPRD